MKVLLAAAHQISFGEPHSLYNCLGVLTLSACLKERGLSCEVVDLYDYNRLAEKKCEATLDEIARKIAAQIPQNPPKGPDSPDSNLCILGFSAMTSNLPLALEVTRRVKELAPHVWIALGGPGASFSASEVLANFSWVDSVFRGEAERSFPEFVERYREKKSAGQEGLIYDDFFIEGMVYRKGGQVVDGGWPEGLQNLDELPFPDYNFGAKGYGLGPPSEYGDYNGISVEVGRGCPFGCIFCSTSRYFKRKYRLKSAARVVDEVMEIERHLGKRRIIFNHDLLTLRRGFVEELCGEILRRVPGLVWKCHARLDTLDNELLDMMAKAGCNEIFLGLEGATEKMQRAVGKNLDVSRFGVPVEWAREGKILFSLSFIVGFEEEGEDDLEAMFQYAVWAKFVAGERVRVKIHTLAPLTGSPLFEKWRGGLAYDEVESRGTTDIPQGWRGLREEIRRHEDIFSIYFHYPFGGALRERAARAELMGRMIDSYLPLTFRLIYLWLGDGAGRALVGLLQKMGALKAKGGATARGQYRKERDFAERGVEALAGLFRGDPVRRAMVESLGRFEIISRELWNQKGRRGYEIIEGPYNPLQIIAASDPREGEANKELAEIAEGSKTEKKFRQAGPLLVAWDKKTRQLTCRPLPGEAARLMALLEKSG